MPHGHRGFVKPDVIGEPIIAVVGKKWLIHERGSQRMLEKISSDDRVKNFIQRFDGGVVEMAKLERERAREDHGQQCPGQAR